MPTGKRASMREGPLAALFRKTAEDAGAKEPTPEQGAPTEQRTSGEHQAPPERTARPERAAPHEREAPAEPGHAPGAEPAHIPSPQERLQKAFSADIPENVLERTSPQTAERDVFARPERPASGFAPGTLPVEARATPVLRVVGVGGAGVNAVNRMVEAEIEGVEFLAINTDLQSLQTSAAHDTLHIGGGVTRGLGSGSDPELGRRAAQDEYDRIKAMLRGSDMVFIAAGAGGGTGTGAAPIVAQIARELGAITVGIVTRPFQFEGTRRRDQAEAGIVALAEEVDTLIVVPNNRLLTVLDKNTSMVEAFRVADDVLRQGVQGVSDLVTLPGLINLDFADVRTIMSGAGSALLGIGMGTGDRRALEAAEKAVCSPLLETSMDGARSILLSITGGLDLSLWEVNEAARAVAEAAHPDANIIFGAMVDDKLEDQVWVTVVATGYGEPGSRRGAADQRASRLERNGDRMREPRGEPRVSRIRERPARGERKSDIRTPMELDVPEFIPRR